ncbi:MAG: site-2 protease family protein [Planctomycetia bacterium]|nr:site-2 protease family protein [Planctomycetia bacterium]
MNSNIPDRETWPDATGSYDTAPVVAEVVPEPPQGSRAVPLEIRRRWRVPLLLFVLTCLSTFVAYPGDLIAIALIFLSTGSLPAGVSGSVVGELAVMGLQYSACLMTILLCHEMGHFLQTKRYGVPATLPFFIPMPMPPIGTMGAVIAMSRNMGNRRALFDIGITGPLAGLVPTLVFCVVGLHWSEVTSGHAGGALGAPLLLRFLVWLVFGSLPEGRDIVLHPMAFVGWVGLLITSLNLIPIGQLDGGHVLYALLRKKAHRVAQFLLMAAAVAVVVSAVVYHYPMWILMVLLLFVMGPIHPPTANDDVPLGTARIVLGWLTLAFIFVGFTPTPFKL